ncbi:MAG: HD domain-containing protein [Vallitaleaceae bacterium]|jgi:uncharacterized protein|nr:HD domain-containing protein [Vallitaleaceae bacterium]
MKKTSYDTIEKYMLTCMTDSAHDCQHIYRVLYYAIDLAIDYKAVVDMKVLIAAALLHDIGRDAQFKDSSCDHALVGGKMAYDFLISAGWDDANAHHVRAAIETHRYRNDNMPATIEAKILFDADKLDVTGAVGIARTIAYKGQVAQPMYSVDMEGQVLPGSDDEPASFFHEYNWKLKKIYDRFYTKKAEKIAKEQQKASEVFYKSMLEEVERNHNNGLNQLKAVLING